MGRDGIVSSFYCFDASWYPGKRHPVPRPQFDLVLHQVRAPLPTIASMQTGRSWRWTCQFLPVGVDAPLLMRCAYNWLIFNEAAEAQAVLTYRIEALEEAWPELQRLLGFTQPYSVVASMPRDIHARPHARVTWGDIMDVAPAAYTGIREAAARYGYG